MFTMEIARLIERCRQGDADALGELYKAYAHKMRGVCRRYISDEQAVDDVLHDAFVIIFTSFDRLRDASKADGWMMSITRNVASKYKDYLDSQPFVPLEEAELLAAPDEERLRVGELGSGMTTVRGIPLEDVLRMVKRLPEGYGQVFRLSVFDGMSHKEIATMLGIEPHSSSSQLARAKKMLRKMMQQYWAVLLLLLIVPVTLLLLRKEEAAVREEKPVCEHQPSVNEHRPTPVVTKQKEKPKSMAHTVNDITLADTIPITERKESTDSTAVPHEPRTPDIPHHHIDVQIAELSDSLPIITDDLPTKKESLWNTMLAYAGIPSNGTTVIDNFLTVVDYASGSQTRSMRIYNWGEYIDYVNNYASQMDSVDAMNMRRIAIFNAGHPKDPISERKYHEHPRTFELSLSYPLSKRWSLTSGLSYTRMKSTFESDGHNMLTRRTQKLYYVGIPLKLTYTLYEKKRWQLYTSGGLQLDIPVCGKESTQYLYADPSQQIQLGDSLIMPTSRSRVNAPWQWSVNVGAGVQYHLLPHVNAYFEPRLQYYIPTSSPIETYRTEHPFDLSLPFGIRFTW